MQLRNRFLVLSLGAFLVAAVHAQEQFIERLQNAGFEQLKDGKLVSWTGYIELASGADVAHTGKQCVRMAARPGKDGHTSLLRSKMTRMYYTVGARHRFSLWAKGKGQLRLGYDTSSPQPAGSPYAAHMWQREPVTLTDEWKQYMHDFSVIDPYSARCINVRVELRGEGAEAFVDDASLALAPPAATDIDVFPIHGMTARGAAAELEFAVSDAGTPVGAGKLELVVEPPDGKVERIELDIDRAGVARHRLAVPADLELDPGKGTFYRFLAVHAASGEARFGSVEVVERDTYEQFAAAAARVRLKTLPAHVLFIGDSLSDGQRGFNYADKVGFWLRQVNGRGVSYKNVGVGGDYISRVWGRLNRDVKQYRWHAYERIYDPMPTHVLVFLGHNDSKENSKSGKTCVPRDRFEGEFRSTLEKLRQDTDARVLVMSSSSSAYEVISPNWPKWEKSRPKGFSKFGIPKVMEEFNTMMKSAAAATGVEYLDVYAPTRDYPDKPSLFTADGVHVNNKGNRFLALQILEYLGTE